MDINWRIERGTEARCSCLACIAPCAVVHSYGKQIYLMLTTNLTTFLICSIFCITIVSITIVLKSSRKCIIRLDVIVLRFEAAIMRHIWEAIIIVEFWLWNFL